MSLKHLPLVRSLKQLGLVKLLIKLYKQLSGYFAYLFFRNNTGQKKFIIFGQGRTGSALLVTLLNSHPEIFCEGEIISKSENWPNKIMFILAFINGRKKLFKNKVYGFKVKLEHFTKDQKVKQPELLLQKLLINGFKIIYLKRTNFFEHALSNLVVEMNGGKWHYFKEDGEIKIKKILLSREVLFSTIRYRENKQKQELEILKNLPYITVVYEEDLIFSQYHQKTANKIFNYLGVSEFPVGTKMVKTNANKKIGDIILNAEEVKDWLNDSEYKKLLEEFHYS